MPFDEALLCVAMLTVAFLYSSVGHGGASGYIAVMALAQVSSTIIRPTSLVLNIVVAAIGSVQFWRAGHFRCSLFWPFAIGSIPAAFYGGSLTLPTRALNILIAVVLLLSAVRLLIQLQPAAETHAPSKPIALVTGGVLGFLAGLTGTGGGIFLTPLMIILRWASTKEAAAVSVVYILVNSVAGLAGAMQKGITLPPYLGPLIGAVVIGGSFGSYFGSRRFSVPVIHVLLASVLILAGGKLILTKPPVATPPKTSGLMAPETWHTTNLSKRCALEIRFSSVSLIEVRSWPREKAHNPSCRVSKFGWRSTASTSSAGGFAKSCKPCANRVRSKTLPLSLARAIGTSGAA